ncbi:hypothetical protein ACK8P5_12885 [Paenibacillus sp. EC2-1]|uniref:hypothetical protein n=1 Tax=Paenibacillus sp. EC2-1 TaxID=3388665 RepID=UPI003BEF3F94
MELYKLALKSHELVFGILSYSSQKQGWHVKRTGGKCDYEVGLILTAVNKKVIIQAKHCQKMRLSSKDVYNCNEVWVNNNSGIAVTLRPISVSSDSYTRIKQT